MLNSVTKQKINNLRDLLVGKIPNPQGQVQQITLALIYKFMSDIDDETSGIFANGSFFPGEFAQYKWTYLMDSKLSAQERLNLYAEGLEKMNHNPAVPPLFRTIFKQAFLPYRDATTLSSFLKQIDEFHYEHSEDLGDAFEYLLSCLSAAGDAGQFRTPRHIIDFIVDVVQPQITDKIMDPACGTAGFLISAYKYLTRHNRDIDMTKLSDQIVGYDISPDMVQLALVNLYLHQFPDPKVMEYDTLTSEDRRSERFDCILANPPFMTPKGGIQPHNKFSITSNRSEVLFVDYIMEHLRSTGKAGIIVPEGVIFQSANAYKALRKMLIETGGLWAVVSLPAGVFQPYSGVKTSILLLDKTITTDEIIFAKITADGYDLGAQRREISKNNIPTVLEGLLNIKDSLTQGSLPLDKGGWGDLLRSTPKADILASSDYNLSAERYKTGAIAHTGSYEMVELGEVCELINGRAYKQEELLHEGKYTVLRVGNLFTKNDYYYSDLELDQDKYIDNGDLIYARSASFGPRIWQGNKVIYHYHIWKVKIDETKINKKYLFNILMKDVENIKGDTNGGTMAHVTKEKMEKRKIPLPPLEIQEQIVAELDGYQAIINGARQIISHRKPKIEIQPEWEMVKLGEVCETSSGGTPLKSKNEYYEGGTIPRLRSGEVAQGFITNSELFITEEGLKNSSAKLFPVDTVLVAMYGATAGQVGLLKFQSTTNQAVCGVFPSEKYLPEFLFQALRDQKELMISLAGGGAQPNISQTIIRDLTIPLPPLEIQQSIIARIQHEQSLVDSAKELVRIYEEKVKERVERVWMG